ncbi:hypothetical protein [Glycomyces salinus]|uniref:hypothetical protein n=1 Tax=Glycomyces salinus TaxID=980294 RepID=UPI0018ED89C9|nr:hypothetical protein [Glycomyces salinus]
MPLQVMDRLRHESANAAGAALTVWLTLRMPATVGHDAVTAPMAAAFVAPLVVVSIHFGAESRRMVQQTRPRDTRLLRLAWALCVALVLGAVADLAWRWSALGGVERFSTMSVMIGAALSYVGCFHRRIAWTSAGRPRLARSSIRQRIDRGTTSRSSRS